MKSYHAHGIGELFHCAPNIPHYASILKEAAFPFEYSFALKICLWTKWGTQSIGWTDSYFMILQFQYLLLHSVFFLRPLCMTLTLAENKAVGVMKAGQSFTIEPMINAGNFTVLIICNQKFCPDVFIVLVLFLENLIFNGVRMPWLLCLAACIKITSFL